MHRSRPLSFLMAFAMAALLLLGSESAFAQPREILLPLKFNEVPQEDARALIEGDDVFLAIPDLERAGVTGPMWQRLLNFVRLISGARRVVHDIEFISLKAMAPYLSFTFDQATLSLSVNSNPQLLAQTRVNAHLTPPADIVYSKDNSTFLNYSVTSQTLHRPSFFAESGTSIRGNLLLNSASENADGSFDRLLSSYTIDDRTRLRRWTIGDATATTDLLGGSAIVGGVTVQRNFGLNPYFVPYPPLDVRGTALTPSRVEVYVNGSLVAQQEIAPGPFELNNIPAVSGAGNAQIVVRDVFGRAQVINQPFYYSTGVLERGLSEFTYSAGAIRNHFGSRSFDYGQPSLLAFHRYGFTDAFTAGGRIEGSRNLISGGPNATFGTRAGEFSLTLAASDDRGSVGSAGSFGYTYLTHHFSIGGVFSDFSRHYANVSLRREADRPLQQSNVFTTLLLSRLSLSLLWNNTRLRDNGHTSRIALLSNVPVTRRASVFLSVGSANNGNGRSAEVFTGLTIFLGGTTTAQVTVDHHNGQTQTSTQIEKALPVGTGYGYRLQTAFGDGQRTGSGVVQYQTGFGRYEVDFDPLHTNVRPTISAAGGVVYQEGAFLFTRPVQDSFALVRVPGVPDVRVYASNNLIGRTDAAGDLLVPNLLPYYGNRLRIEDRDVPINYEIGATEQTIAPPYRGGAFVNFAVRPVHTITGSVSIRTPKEEVVPVFGQLTLTANGKTFQSPLGHTGEFYFENLPAGKYDALIEYRDGDCRFHFDVPARSEAMVTMGHLFCRSGANQP